MKDLCALLRFFHGKSISPGGGSQEFLHHLRLLLQDLVPCNDHRRIIIQPLVQIPYRHIADGQIIEFTFHTVPRLVEPHDIHLIL